LQRSLHIRHRYPQTHNTMAGLESIALAVAHLERAQEAEAAFALSAATSPTSEEIASKTGSSPGGASSLGFTGATSAASIPSRQLFSDTSARLVSSDSIHSQDAVTVSSPDAGSDEEERSSVALPVVSPPSSRNQSASDITSIMDPTTASTEDLAADLMVRQHQLPAPPPPTEAITQVLEDDVLCGRGGETNHHSGNIKYRTLVKCYQPLYIVSKRRDKPRIAQKIVFTIRQRGGRFLKKDARSNTWRDVGNTKAREKTSQALREGAPDLRHGGDADSDSPSPTTVPTSAPSEVVMMNGSPANATAGMNSMAHMPSFQFHHQQQAATSAATMGLTSAAAALYMASCPSRIEGGFDHGSGLKRTFPSLSGLPMHAAGQHPQTSLLERMAMPMGASSPMIYPSESFAATISADDDEDASPTPEVTKSRGPRLKRLKSRKENSSY
jgi:hypothetical protein